MNTAISASCCKNSYSELDVWFMWFPGAVAAAANLDPSEKEAPEQAVTTLLVL